MRDCRRPVNHKDIYGRRRDKRAMATCNGADRNLQAEVEAQEERVKVEAAQAVDSGTSNISNHWQITRTASKIRHGVGTAVKKGVGMLKNKLVRKELELDGDFKPDFLSTCEAFDKRLRVSKYKLSIARDLDKTREQFMEKRILIGVIGFYNTGKSTLLNSLLRARLLPMKMEAETSAQVLIQHIRNDLPQVQSTAAASREHKEPTLEVTNVEGIKVVHGVEGIYEELQALNANVRSDHQNHKVKGQRHEEEIERRDDKMVPACTLLTRVPFLADAPDDWHVNLVDTPGFGESVSHVEMLAIEAQKSSSAYVFITTYETLNAQSNTNCLRSILAHDQGVFKGNRLIIVVTKFDKTIDSADLSDSNEEMSEEKVKKRACQFVHKACDVEFPHDDVLVVSGSWAYCARMLDMTPPYGPTQCAHKRYQANVKKCLRGVPNSTCGQGEDLNVSLDKLGDDELSAKLEEASGIAALEERIKIMTKSCVEIWVDKIKGDYERYSKAVKDEMSQASSKFLKSIQYYEKLQKSKMDHLEAIDALRKELKENPRVDEEIAQIYQVDLEQSKSQQIGKRVARDLVATFRSQCVMKVKDKKVEFGPRQLEADMKDFLESSTIVLDDTFSSTCTFPRMSKVLMKHVYEMKVKVDQMRRYARLLSPRKATTLLEKTGTNDEEAQIDPSELLEPLEKQEPFEPTEIPEPPELQELKEPPVPPELLETPEPANLLEPLEPPEPPVPPEPGELLETPEPANLLEPLEPPESPVAPELLETPELTNLLEPPVPQELLRPPEPGEPLDPPKTPVPPDLEKQLEPQNTPELLETLDLLQPRKPLEPLSLGDIKEKVKIPSVSLSVWSKFKQFCSKRATSFVTFWRRVFKMETTEQHSVNPNTQQQTDAYPKPSRNEDGNLSDETTSVKELNESKAENLSDESNSAAQTGENKAGASSDRTAAELNEGYRKWNDELEETIITLQQFLEEQCDAYFVDIKQRAVKYFHDQYCHEAKTELAAFEAKFKEDIDKQKKEVKKLKKTIEDNRSKVLEVKEMCCHFNNLEVHLNEKAQEYLQAWLVA